jgi:hypothetical protein
MQNRAINAPDSIRNLNNRRARNAPLTNELVSCTWDCGAMLMCLCARTASGVPNCGMRASPLNLCRPGARHLTQNKHSTGGLRVTLYISRRRTTKKDQLVISKASGTQKERPQMAISDLAFVVVCESEREWHNLYIFFHPPSALTK